MDPSAPDLVIRDATLDDVEAVASIHVEGWETSFRGMLPDDVIDVRSLELRRRTWSERIEGDPEDEFLRLAVIEGAVVAFTDYGATDEPGLVLWKSLYVRPSAQRLGLGTELVVDTRRILLARGYSRFQGWVMEGNQGSRSWMDSMGFQFTGDVRDREEGRFREMLYELDLASGGSLPRGGPAP